MRYKLIISPEAKEDLKAHEKAGNKILLKKIAALFWELEENPTFGTGKPKKLKYKQTLTE